MALTVGADAALDPLAVSFKDQVTALVGDGFDVAFEASGAPPALCQAFESVRRGGTLVQIGVFSAPELSLPINQLMIREIQFLGSFRYGNVWEEGIRLVASGRVNLQPLISQVLPLESVMLLLLPALIRTVAGAVAGSATLAGSGVAGAAAAGGAAGCAGAGAAGAAAGFGASAEVDSFCVLLDSQPRGSKAAKTNGQQVRATEYLAFFIVLSF